MTIPVNLLQAFEAIYGYLDVAREIVRAGQSPDMMGLDQRVSGLCAAIEASDPDIRQECLPKLDQLLRSLDHCEEEIRKANVDVDGIKDKIGESHGN